MGFAPSFQVTGLEGEGHWRSSLCRAVFSMNLPCGVGSGGGLLLCSHLYPPMRTKVKVHMILQSPQGERQPAALPTSLDS